MHETSVFRRGPGSLPLWARAVLLGWMLIVPLVVIGLVSEGNLADCFSSCPPPPPEAEQNLRSILVSAATAGWLALPTLVVAGLRWSAIRGLIACLGVFFGAIALAGALGIGGRVTAWMALTWPASIVVAAGALVPARPGSTPERSMPSDVVITAAVTVFVLAAFLTATGFLFIVGLVAFAVGVRAWNAARARES